jgi:two-component system LytT family response regulator
VRLHVGSESHLLRETMTALESRLDPAQFMRIHRSRIVNVERIRKIEPGANGDYTVTLSTGVTLTLSRSYRSRLEERFGSL